MEAQMARRQSSEAKPPAARMVLSVAEACRVCGISRAWFYRLCKRGLGPPIVRLPGRRTLIRVDALQAWLKQWERRDD